MDVRFLAPQADGLGVGNEVDFVPALRELKAQFGSDNTTSAVRRITRDSDLHLRGAAFCMLL
jgi:hypothetical protein